MSYCLVNFHEIRPQFDMPQEHILDWIASAHTHAETTKSGMLPEGFEKELKDRLFRVGFGADKIQRRGMHTKDFSHQEWSEMSLYPVKELSTGSDFAGRSQSFDDAATSIFEQFYPQEKRLPEHLIHVTCTGYVAPSPAQKLVSKRGAQTVVTNAYHMGCYASIPAIRMGAGFLHLPFSGASPQVDIVHTELSSLHFHPLKHSTEQLVVQSLFADGFIKYTIAEESNVSVGTYFKVLTLREELIPDSTESMTWRCEDNGLSMTIAKEVPVLISRALEAYVQRLQSQALEKRSGRIYYAVHPGGPRILEQVQKVLKLEDWQLTHSHAVLRSCGNMSSGTLPHIWRRMLEDSQVESGSLIISLAFGPGLSLCGALFEKKEA